MQVEESRGDSATASMCGQGEVEYQTCYLEVRFPKIACKCLVSLIYCMMERKALGDESRKLILCACHWNLFSSLDRATL